ncbi:GIY-YIG nuclease family protein (plasmid) [Radiobacillus kanasensis]|uniref:GIY-YIG nuclease family protein n=1 Tax=Radiobacillus kanasensis TaxID=2844358 RepID=UPI001E4A46E1|nr:GIY-YIG nuclease family protein [Radiobacillus kanasensis]UFU01506.1 GIY-YIG nuclease family protein [Radiobacillus kanasensis]
MEKNSNHYVYMLRCKDGSLYTGYTNNVEKRLKVHEEGKGAKYTRGRGPFELVFVEEYETKGLALQQEHRMKKLTRKEKEKLIQASEGRKNG